MENGSLAIGTCSEDGDKGVQTRSVECKIDGASTTDPNSSLPKPKESRACNRGSVPHGGLEIWAMPERMCAGAASEM